MRKAVSFIAGLFSGIFAFVYASAIIVGSAAETAGRAGPVSAGDASTVGIAAIVLYLVWKELR